MNNCKPGTMPETWERARHYAGPDRRKMNEAEFGALLLPHGERRKSPADFVADCDCGFQSGKHADDCPACPDPAYDGPNIFNPVA
jgi:hypothetical protein